MQSAVAVAGLAASLIAASVGFAEWASADSGDNDELFMQCKVTTTYIIYNNIRNSKSPEVTHERWQINIPNRHATRLQYVDGVWTKAGDYDRSNARVFVSDKKISFVQVFDRYEESWHFDDTKGTYPQMLFVFAAYGPEVQEWHGHGDCSNVEPWTLP